MELLEHAGDTETVTGAVVVLHPAYNNAMTAAAPSSIYSQLYLRLVEFTTFALFFAPENIHFNIPTRHPCYAKVRFTTTPALPYPCRAEPVQSIAAQLKVIKDPTT